MSDPFFNRGPGPLVSVIFATRGRPEMLAKAAASYIDLAKDRSRIEFVLRVDNDDQPTRTMMNELTVKYAPVPVRAVFGPHGRGYTDMHLFLNQCAREAKGDWLFIADDDSTITSPGWDEWLANHAVPWCWHGCPQDVLLGFPETNGSKYLTEKVVMRRRAFEIMGHVCLSPHGDTWLFHVFEMLRSAFRCPGICVSHPQGPHQHFFNVPTGPYSEGIGTLDSVSGVLGKVSAVNRLLAHIAAYEESHPWLAGPSRPGWHQWWPSPERGPVHVWVGPDGIAEGNPAIGLLESTPVAKMGGAWRARTKA